MMPAATRAPILRDGRLGGVPADELATRYGTPLFVYDLDVITAQVDALRGALPPCFDLAYAVKANPLLAVLEHVRRRGLGADVASGGELRHVLRAGFDPSRVLMTGPGKRDEELAAAVGAGIGTITVESRGELARLAAIAGAAGRVQPVLLRLSMSGAGGAERVRIIGDEGAGKFGMDRADLGAAAREAVASPWLEPLGIHAFGASNLLDADALAAHVAATVDTAIEVARDAGFRLRLVDAGGGLGIPYADDEAPLDLGLLRARLAVIATRLAAEPATADVRVLLEPGRFLVGPSGAYVARVTDRKRVAGSEVAVLDGGVHHVLRPALVGQAHRVVALTGAAAGAPGAGHGNDPDSGHGEAPDDDVTRPAPDAPVTLAGPLCTGLDILARDAPLGGLATGDLVAVLDVGAYGATESMPLFLNHPMPAEVVIRDGAASLARPRIDPDVWLGWHVEGA